MEEPRTPRELQQRFPYMFEDRYWQIESDKGWFALMILVCHKIEKELGDETYRFRWRQVKEKFGTLRLHFELRPRRRQGSKAVATDGAMDRAARTRPTQALFAAVLKHCRAATRLSGRICIVCGQPGRCHSLVKSHWLLTLCNEHAEMDLTGNPLPERHFDDKDEIDFVVRVRHDLPGLVSKVESRRTERRPLLTLLERSIEQSKK